MDNFALLFQTLEGFENQNQIHITRHPIHNSESGAVILAGQPIGAEIVEDLIVALEGSQKERVALLDDRVLAKTGTAIVWYRKSTRTTFRFLQKEAVVEVECEVPSLIFCASAGKLNVVAYKGNKKPTSDTRLYRAPFPNVSSSGSMCLGSNKLDHFVSESMLDFVEELFFESEFTYELDGNCLRTIKGYDDLIAFYQQLGSDTNAFPTRKLVPMRRGHHGEAMTLNNWLNRFH